MIKISINKQKSSNFSTSISNFCKFINEAQNNYAWHTDEINRLDKLTQDYLHKLELEGLNYRERAKVATQLMRCRQQRRISKDVVEMLSPFVDFMCSDKGKNTYNILREVLGQTRKVEERINNRSYRYRVLEAVDNM